MRIVPALDVAEEDETCVRVRREPMFRQAFTFERGEKAFGHGVDAPICQDFVFERYAASLDSTASA